jgi:putative mRNA 3-end processing factor
MQSYQSPLIAWTEKGLFCEAGGFYIDPHRKVDLAIVTHAHSDHARRGSQHYICETSGVGLLRCRIGKNISVEGRAYGERFRLGDVIVSLHSAGHILGSAQVRVQLGSEIWVASGDYKRDSDPSCEPFETVPCHTFITEATFGTPKFTWNKEAQHGADLAQWWDENAALGINSIVFGYSLGKGQRILAELAAHPRRPILIHSAMEDLTECYRAAGRILAPTRSLDEVLAGNEVLSGEMILAPPSVLTGEWAHRLGKYRTAFASGWMQTGGFGGSYSRYDHGFVISDHADWNDLNRTIEESGASRVFVQHRNGALVRHLRSRKIEAYPSEDLIPERYARLPQKNLNLFEPVVEPLRVRDPQSFGGTDRNPDRDTEAGQ